jgi:hypothetical protein
LIFRPPSNGFLAETNVNPKPFSWTADPDRIIATVNRGYQALDLLASDRRRQPRAQAVLQNGEYKTFALPM